MAKLIPQFQDLTEVIGIGYLGDGETIQTEFSFAIAAPGQSISGLTKLGFKHISSMNNWWPTHAGQNRELKFLWLKNQNKPTLQVQAERRHWGYFDEYEALSTQLAASGCGFKLAVPPISLKEHYRYFTLIRMPVKVNLIQLKLLKKLNYRLVDIGKLASYWINGWEPEVYSHAMEYKFFGITKEIWARNGGNWKSYDAKQHLV